MPPRDRTKRRVTPRQDRARASIEAILTAAEILLREVGFARMTTNRIADRAGVNVALVYRYFAGKEAIVGALIERVAEATQATVRTVLEKNAQAPMPQAIRALLGALAGTPGDPALHRELVEHVGAAKRRQLVEQLRMRVTRQFSDFMAARQPDLRPLADRDATMFVLQHAIEAATHAAAFYRPDGLSLERVLDALTDLVLRALLPEARRAA
jgi:AcrR family transcriptional regulator